MDDVLSSSKGRRGLRQRGPRTVLDFDDLIYGIHAVEEALLAGERLRSIAVAADRTKDAALRVLLAPVRFEQRAFFDRVPFKAHQGVIATAPPFPYASLGEVLARPRPDGSPRMLVVLDHLTDPQNVGAIFRSASRATTASPPRLPYSSDWLTRASG